MSEKPTVTNTHAMEFTVLNFCSLEMINPPIIAVTGTNTVPGRMDIPEASKDRLWATRNCVESFSKVTGNHLVDAHIV
jgi:hypothetical protein